MPRLLGVCLVFAVAALLPLNASALQPANPHPDNPLRVGVVGLVHGHVDGFFRRQQDDGTIEVVGIAEPDRALARQYAERFSLDDKLLYSNLEAMLTAVQPEAVVVFTSTFDHRRVVEASARHGIHVMMEKPMAVNMEHAQAMQRAAQEGNIHVLVNYETSWYPSNRTAYDLVRRQEALGTVHKMVVRDGHQGPKEIGVGPAFLSWLTDPKLNGGGALMDFGCYGANLMTWIMGGRRPTAVTAITQHFKTDSVYAEVEDEATILVTYPEAQGIIEASWNWPYSRKDMSIYGQNGYVHADAPTAMRIRMGEEAEQSVTPTPLPPPYDGPLSYLTAVVRNQIEPTGLSSLQNNMIVTEILDAAKRSAETGQTVHLAPTDE